MRLLFYGIGKFYQKRRNELIKLCADDEIIGLVDRKASKCRIFDGLPVYLPEEVSEQNFDEIVITSTYTDELYATLTNLHISAKKILFYEQFIGGKRAKESQIYGSWQNCCGSKIVLVTDSLCYNGGAMAIIHAAVVLAKSGYRVTLVATTADKKMLRELSAFSVKFGVMPFIRYSRKCSLTWLREYDVCLVNNFTNASFAAYASEIRPVLWWIHEPSDKFTPFYSETRRNFPDICAVDFFDKLRIAAVNTRAKKNFEIFYPNRIDTILPYCLPDTGEASQKTSSGKIVFALVADVQPRKGQDVFVHAIELLSNTLNEQAEFWLIGAVNDAKFFNHIERRVMNKPSIKMLGLLTREEMRKAYQSIDVVVCASREECLPTTMAEGMMYSKICIATDMSGMENIIENGENGFIVPTENAEALADCMARIIEQPGQYKDMRAAARKTYEEYFIPEKFLDNLTRELSLTIKSWNAKQKAE